jgi:hypothetical protein
LTKKAGSAPATAARSPTSATGTRAITRTTKRWRVASLVPSCTTTSQACSPGLSKVRRKRT